MRSRMLLGVGFAMAIIAGCGGDGGGSSNNNTGIEYCGNEYQLNQLHAQMDSQYFWYKDMPSVDPQEFVSNAEVMDDLEALLDVLTLPEQNLGKHYSYLTTAQEEQDLLNNAAYAGFGFSSSLTAGSRLFLREVFEGRTGVAGLPDIDPSPAYAAGMRRGDEILAINGTIVAALAAAGTLNDAFGPSDVGVTREFEVRHANGIEETISVTKDEVTVPTVSYAQAFDRDGNGTKETGYVFFRSFLSPSPSELNAVFGSAEWQGVTKLVLDLRYNGGGLVTVAKHLGGLIAGVDHAGDVFAKQIFNDKNSAKNETSYLALQSASLPITDMVVITSGGTASSSELVINGLKPFINVKTVGDTSYGKPVGQSGIQFCDTILRAVTFETVNKNDEGRYFNGIPADCAADDDVTHYFGDAGEASLAEALHVLENGACSAGSPKAQYNLAKQHAVYGGNRNPLYRDGWDVFTGGMR